MAQRRLKRQRRARQLQDSLVAHLEHSGAGSDVKAFLEALQQWLTEHMDRFSRETQRADQMEEFATMKLDPLPIMYSEFDSVHELKRLRDVPPDSISGVAMWLGTLFWEGVTVLSNRECPVCESFMRVMEEQHTGYLGYVCDVCPHEEPGDRVSFEGSGPWGPATTETLQRRGRLSVGMWIPDADA